MTSKLYALLITAAALTGCQSSPKPLPDEIVCIGEEIALIPPVIPQEKKPSELESARANADFLAVLKTVRNQKDPVFNSGNPPKIEMLEEQSDEGPINEIRERVKQIDSELATLEDSAALSFSKSESMPAGFEDQHFLLSEERNQLLFELEIEGIGNLGRLRNEKANYENK